MRLSFARGHDDQTDKDRSHTRAGEAATFRRGQGRASAIIRCRRHHVETDAARLLTIKRLDVDIAGSGDIEAAPQEALNVDIAGSGNIRLLSDPAVVHTDIKGSGRVIRASSR